MTNSLTERIQQLTWGRKTIFFLMVILVLLMVGFTILMETTHGPYTPNGNRYYSRFSIGNVQWETVILFFVAYFLLLLPWWKFCFGNKYNFRGISIFPVKPHNTVVPGTLLTLWSVFTTCLFSLTFCTYSYLSYKKQTILLDDEYPMIVAGYVTCILFWGIVDFIYWLLYWRKEKVQQFTQFSPSQGERIDWMTYDSNKR